MPKNKAKTIEEGFKKNLGLKGLAGKLKNLVSRDKPPSNSLKQRIAESLKKKKRK